MKRIIIFLITTLHCVYSNSQNLKTFSGEIVDGHELQHGNVTYTYYEDPKTHEIVKQGQFKYVFIGEGENYKGFNETITGSFNKGLKTGTWKYNVTYTDWNNQDRYWTGTTVFVANYLNGYADGNWKETTNSKNRKLYMSYGKYVWGQFENLNYDTIIMNFKNNYLVGKMHVNDKFHNNYIDGNFDNNSFFVGNWTFNNFDWEYRISATFKEGFNYYYIKRGNDMHISFGPETYDAKYTKLSNALKMTSPEREDAGYTIDTIGWAGCPNCFDGNFKQYIDKLLNNDSYIYEAIGGDLTYKKGISGGFEIDLKENKFNKFSNKGEELIKTINGKRYKSTVDADGNILPKYYIIFDSSGKRYTFTYDIDKIRTPQGEIEKTLLKGVDIFDLGKNGTLSSEKYSFDLKKENFISQLSSRVEDVKDSISFSKACLFYLSLSDPNPNSYKLNISYDTLRSRLKIEDYKLIKCLVPNTPEYRDALLEYIINNMVIDYNKFVFYPMDPNTGNISFLRKIDSLLVNIKYDSTNSQHVTVYQYQKNKLLSTISYLFDAGGPITIFSITTYKDKNCFIIDNQHYLYFNNIREQIPFRAPVVEK